VNRKQEKVAGLIERHLGQELDAHYLAFFDSFEQGRFYEAHEVLEELWLAERGGPNAGFYKGLIQLAGAFVHWNKNRPEPAASLLRLARGELGRYSGIHQRLDIEAVLKAIDGWLGQVQADPGIIVSPRVSLERR
jgi:thioredoxin-like negative regulator of GroEL